MDGALEGDFKCFTSGASQPVFETEFEANHLMKYGIVRLPTGHTLSAVYALFATLSLLLVLLILACRVGCFLAGTATRLLGGGEKEKWD